MKKAINPIVKAVLWFFLYFGINIFASALIALIIAFAAGADVLAGGSMGDIMGLISVVLIDYVHIISIGTSAITLLVIFLIIKAQKRRAAEELFFKPVKPLMTAAVIVTGMALNFVVMMLLGTIIPEEILEQYGNVSDNLLGNADVWMFFSVVIFAPVLEEVVFRGLIFSNLKKKLPLWVALAIQAFLFGLMHGQIVWVIYATLLGVIMGLVFYKTGSLIAPILLHFGFNLISFILTALEPPEIVYGIFAIVSIILSAGGLIYIFMEKGVPLQDIPETPITAQVLKPVTELYGSADAQRKEPEGEEK